MEETVMNVLAEAIGTEADQLDSDLELFEEELLDSFGVISLLVGIEDALGIRIEPTEITREEISTPAKLIACVKARA